MAASPHKHCLSIDKSAGWTRLSVVREGPLGWEQIQCWETRSPYFKDIITLLKIVISALC